MNYKFIVISDEPQHPIVKLKYECKVRSDIPEDIVKYITLLQSDYVKEE